MRVYFIKPIGHTGPYKIGCSVSPTGRRESLRAWCPLPLEIVAEIEGDHCIERRFHAMFLEHHEGHEWFSDCAEIRNAIASIRAGTFDLDDLPEPVSLRPARGKTKLEDRHPEAASLINRLGGTTFVARKLGIPVQTVQGWKNNGIPKGRVSQVEALA